MRAARRRGQWTGGHPVLGYDIDPGGGRLLVNPVEAQQVRATFDLFIEKRSLRETLCELNGRGWTSKSWSTRGGTPHGGKPFTVNSLRRLLLNPAYLGLVTIGDELHPAQHPAILDRTTWERVHALVEAGEEAGRRYRPRCSDALLSGLLFCASCGCQMLPGHGGSRDRRRTLKYYVCASGQSGGSGRCSSGALDAALLEQMVIERISGVLPRAATAVRAYDQKSRLRALIDRISYDGQTRRVSIALRGSEEPHVIPEGCAHA
jgi:site-specific DNA recombinase